MTRRCLSWKRSTVTARVSAVTGPSGHGGVLLPHLSVIVDVHGPLDADVRRRRAFTLERAAGVRFHLRVQLVDAAEVGALRQRR